MKIDVKKSINFENTLPENGEVFYHGCILSSESAQHYFVKLLSNINWKPDEVIIFGKRLTTKRCVAWYADKPFIYKYSNIPRQALPWTEELLALKTLVEYESNETYNSCLMNLYHDGLEGMGWHSDDEKELKPYGAISSLSLGAERRFLFKNKSSKVIVPIMLASGSLLVMKGITQRHWLHRLPPTTKIKAPRINLTFRTIMTPESTLNCNNTS